MVKSAASDKVGGSVDTLDVVEAVADAVFEIDEADDRGILDGAAVETGSSTLTAFANKSVCAPSMKPYSLL